MYFLVTGAGGDWGTAIIDAILESGGDVVGLDLNNVHLDVEAQLKQETWGMPIPSYCAF